MREFQNLPHYLRRAREFNGLTQQELAAQVGLPQSTISQIENGKRLPTLLQLVDLARALRVSLQWFSNGSNYPGNDLADLALELQNLGIVDLHVRGARVPTAFRPLEQVIAEAVSGNRLEPRILEALPAVLAWNQWHPSLLLAYARVSDPRAAFRLGWLAEIVTIIHHADGFPGGCASKRELVLLLQSIAPPDATDDVGGLPAERPAPPVSLRWKILYPASIDTFRQRAEHLHSLRRL